MDTVTIDTREPPMMIDALVTEFDERGSNLALETDVLETGDFVMGNVCIERKEASDYLKSITDARMKKQESRMVADFDHRYIILEGSPYNVPRSNMHENSIIGKQISSSTSKDINLIFVDNIDQTAYAVWKIMTTHAEDDGDDEEVLLKKTRADTEDTYIAMLTCITGISQKKASKIAEIYPRMADLALWCNQVPEGTRNRLQDIEGIGPKLSSRIIEEIS